VLDIFYVPFLSFKLDIIHADQFSKGDSPTINLYHILVQLRINLLLVVVDIMVMEHAKIQFLMLIIQMLM
jgi:hypothetical protein